MSPAKNLDTVAGAGGGYFEWDDEDGRHLIRAFTPTTVATGWRVELLPTYSSTRSERPYKAVTLRQAVAGGISTLTANTSTGVISGLTNVLYPLRQYGAVELKHGQSGNQNTWVDVVTKGKCVAYIRAGAVTADDVAAGDYIVIPLNPGSADTNYDTQFARAQAGTTWEDALVTGVAQSTFTHTASGTGYAVTGYIMLLGERTMGKSRTIT